MQEYSESPDKEVDGNIGRLKKEEVKNIFKIETEDADEVFNLKAGSWSRIIMGDDLSYHVFMVTDRKPEIPFSIVNKVMDKNALRALVDYAYRNQIGRAHV